MKLVTAFAAIMLTIAPASAQSVRDIVEARMVKLLGTSYVAFSPVFNGNDLAGCTLEFGALIRDFAYKDGDYARIAGMFGFMKESAENVNPVLKVIVNDLDLDALNQVPDRPQTAFIVDDFNNNTADIVAQFDADHPGGVFVIFGGEPTTRLILEAIILDRQIDIHFRRQNGMMSVPVRLDLTVVETEENGERGRSTEHLDTMTACVQQLAS